MNSNEPVDPRVRLAITQWPHDASRGAVTTFCRDEGISRKSFYKIRQQAREDGPIAALAPRSRRPRSSPSELDDEVKQAALRIRAALEDSGMDHGPISVHDKLVEYGFAAPSPATLARVFRVVGVARLEPKKRPRSSYRRFVYPAPNCLWQLDATGYVLAQGRKCVVFQVIDDHSRVSIASLAAWGETSNAAIAVVAKGIAAYGVPQQLLTDNGAALNPSRRGQIGRLVEYVSAFGIRAITGKPYKPTTQGKNERFHQTLMRYLDKQPIAHTLAELQTQIDAFDLIYNTQRGHQGLPGRMTPAQAWMATPVAEPPRPKPPEELRSPQTQIEKYQSGQAERPVSKNGSAAVIGMSFAIGARFVGQRVTAIWNAEEISFFMPDGELLLRYPKPERGSTSRWLHKKDALEIAPRAG